MSATLDQNSLDWADLAWQITCASGDTFSVRAREPVSGGCIHQAFRLRGEKRSYFLKLNSADCAGMFEAEALGLRELRRCASLSVPQPLCWGRQGEHGYLVLEWLDLKPLAGRSEAALGEALAELHHVTSALYGWSCDNSLGTTRQRNTPEGDWTHFWREHRLGFQLKLAQKKDARLAEPGERLMQALDTLLVGHQPAASLLHGDLWAGNAAQDSRGKPVIFDPAIYYGDREAEIAMMELFGGFGETTLAAYRAAWPLEPGYVEGRRELYQIYHILNHFNLFGGQYADQALLRMDRLLAHVV